MNDYFLWCFYAVRRDQSLSFPPRDKEKTERKVTYDVSKVANMILLSAGTKTRSYDIFEVAVKDNFFWHQVGT